MVHDMDDATGKTVAHSQPNNAEQSLNHTGFAALSTTAVRPTAPSWTAKHSLLLHIAQTQSPG